METQKNNIESLSVRVQKVEESTKWNVGIYLNTKKKPSVRVQKVEGGSMKKKVIIVALLALLVGCGSPKYKMYSVFDKQDMIKKALTDENTKKEIQENMKRLRKAIEKNDAQAKQELAEWQILIQERF